MSNVGPERQRVSARGVTSTVAVVLLVAVTVIVAATVSATVLGLGSELREPGPTVGESSGRLVADAGGSSDQIVRLTHEAGDPVPVGEIEVVVRIPVCDAEGRLVNLPAEGGDLDDKYDEGDDVFDNSANSVSGPIGEDGRTVDGEWTAGETAEFRIAKGECDIGAGDTVVVRVVHEPSGSVVMKQRLTAS